MAYFGDRFLADLRTALSIRAVVERHFHLRKDGPELRAVEDNSLTVNETKNVWMDRSSGEGGDAIAFEQWATGCTFEQAIESLAQVAGMSLPGNGRGKGPSAHEGPPPGHPVNGPMPTSARRKIVATYPYRDGEGLLYEVCRIEWEQDGKRHKITPPRRPCPDEPGHWIWGLQTGEFVRGRDGDWYLNEGDRRGWQGERRVFTDAVAPILYRLPEMLLELRYGEGEPQTIYLPEGEKDADTLVAWGLIATTSMGGTNGWLPDYPRYLEGADVVILMDNDVPGRKLGQAKAASLRNVARRVRVLDWRDHWPGCDEGADVTDWVRDAGGDMSRLLEIVDKLPDWTSQSDSQGEEPPSLSSPDDYGSWSGDADGGSQSTMARPFIKSSAEFVAGFVPPEYTVVGLLQRRFFYSVTAPTGHGKTAVMLLLAAAIALGVPFAGRKTRRARVLYLAAENAEDVRMRWIALAQCMGFETDAIEVYFVEGRFTLSKSLKKLRAEAEERSGEFGLVIVDTGPTFFEGKDENANKEAGDHARLLRSLIDVIPGRPCVVGACHPHKHAGPDDLIPRGGGAYLAEVDGNLTCWITDATVELHWQGKFRGPDFAPMSFLIKTVTHQDLKDRDGNLIPTVIAEYIGEQAKEEIAAAARDNENRVLKLISDNPSVTLASLAIAMEWKLYSGEPNKMRAARIVKELERLKFIKVTRTGRYKLTAEGTKALKGETED